MKRLSSILLILMVLISIGLQLWAASRQSYWEDEAFTAQVVSRGPAGLHWTVTNTAPWLSRWVFQESITLLSLQD